MEESMPTIAPQHTPPPRQNYPWNRPYIKMNLPTFRGGDDYSPFEFLDKFERYAQSQQVPLNEALVSAMPCALEGKAAIWWRFYKKTNKWEDFKEAFLKMFGPSDYFRKLGQELELRTQGPGESLTTFIATIHEYYEKLNSRESDEERVNRVIRQMHPTYKPYMWQRRFRSLHDMMEYAHEVQASLHLDKAYKPPPAPSESVDPSLAYRPTRSETRFPIPSPMEPRSRSQVRFGGEEPRPPSKERRDYSKERARQLDKLIKYPRDENRPRDRSRERDPSPDRRERDSSRDRSGSCYSCGQTGHWSNECPNKVKSGGSNTSLNEVGTKNPKGPSRH
jgi:hypothetical protein